jgi:CRISPR-associated protein Csx10
VQAQEGDIQGRAFPVPLSARTCKYWKGFRAQETGHGVQDFLCRTALYRLGAPAGVLLEIESCSRGTCQQPLDRLDGFVYRRGSRYSHREATTRLLARVAIDRWRQTAAEGILYSLEVLNEDQHFAGRLFSAHAPWLETIRRFGHKAQLRVGVARTRGLGLVCCTLTDNDEGFPGFAERIDKIQAEMDRLSQSYPPAPTTPRAFYFSLTLESDALVPDAFLRYHTSLDASTLASALGSVRPDALHLVAHYSGTRTVQGWNAALGLPKPDALAIAQGSTFLFAYHGEEVRRLQADLQRLEGEGFGLRRGEGFGRIIVCHPFHWEVCQHE